MVINVELMNDVIISHNAYVEVYILCYEYQSIMCICVCIVSDCIIACMRVIIGF